MAQKGLILHIFQGQGVPFKERASKQGSGMNWCKDFDTHTRLTSLSQCAKAGFTMACGRFSTTVRSSHQARLAISLF